MAGLCRLQGLLLGEPRLEGCLHSLSKDLLEVDLALSLTLREEAMVLDVLTALPKVAKALRQIVLSELLDEVLGFGLNARLSLGEDHLLLEDHLEELEGVLVRVGAVTEQQLVEEYAESVPVHCAPVSLVQEDLWCQVLGCPTEGVGPLTWLELLQEPEIR